MEIGMNGRRREKPDKKAPMDRKVHQGFGCRGDPIYADAATDSIISSGSVAALSGGSSTRSTGFGACFLAVGGLVGFDRFDRPLRRHTTALLRHDLAHLGGAGKSVRGPFCPRRAGLCPSTFPVERKCRIVKPSQMIAIA
jgi:hypothetical protein